MNQLEAAEWSVSTLEQRASIEKISKFKQRLFFAASIFFVTAILVLFESLATSADTTRYEATRNRASYPAIPGPIESMASLSPDRCYSFPLIESESDSSKNHSPALLAWTTSGLVAEGQILVADMSFTRLAKMDVGGLVETESRFAYKNPWYLHPIWSEDHSYDGLALLDLRTVEAGRRYPSQVQLYDPSGKVVESMVTSDQELTVPAGQEPVVLWEVQRFAPVSDGVVVNADFIEADDFKNRQGSRYWNTFAYLPWNDEPRRYLPLEIPGDTGGLGGDVSGRRASTDLKEKFYGRDFSYMATVGGTVYVLMMENEPWVGKVDLERLAIDRLPEFPQDLKVPTIEIRQENGELLPGIDRLYRLYRDVERNAMPVGLYSWRERLFVLTKSAANPQNGDTRWTLVEISPETGAGLEHRIVLPTSTEHLAIASGQDFWGIIEKGPIDRLKTSAFPWSQLYRSTSSAVVFSTHTWLADQQVSSAPGQAAQCQEIAIQ